MRVETLEQNSSNGGARSQGEAQQTAPAAGLPIGSPAPQFDIPALDGASVSLHTLQNLGKPILLVFSDPHCGPCTRLLPKVAEWQRESAEKFTITLVSRGDEKANREKLNGFAIDHVLLQKDREVAEAYQAWGTPGAVVVQSDGTISSPVIQGADQIEQFVAHLTLPPPVTLVEGDLAPSIQLLDLDGNLVEFTNLQGQQTLVLFWNLNCGFCSRMIDDLKAWEANSPEASPRMLLISSGSVEANRAMGLQSPIVLDDEGIVSKSFGANGTPIGILVNADGKVASEMAMGGQAVTALMGLHSLEQSAA